MKGIFLDIETNGLDDYIHSPIEVCVSIYELHNMICITEYQTLIKCCEKSWLMASDPRALKINGITFEEVKDAKMHNEVCDDLSEMFLAHEIDKTNSVFICQNPSFDRGFFNQIMPIETQQELELPYHWLDLSSMYWGRMVDPSKEYNGHVMEKTIPLSKDSIASYLGLPPENKPHRATNGVHHLIECYKALMYNRCLN